jgi:hypothetical protein
LTFRNVEASAHDPVASWPYEALVECLERGLLPDWRPILDEVRHRPWGRVARRVERWAHDSDDQAAALFDLVVRHARDRAEADERAEVARRVRESIERSGLTARAFADEIGTSASRLSTYANGRVTPSAAMLLRIESLGAGGSQFT